MRVNLKEVIENKNEAISTLENLHSEHGTNQLTDEAQTKWDEAKKVVNEAERIIARERFIEDKKKDESLRNEDDGEQKEVQKYSFREAIAYATNPTFLNSSKRGFYAEMNQEAEREAKNAGVTLQGGTGITIPTKVLNAVSTGANRDDLVPETFSDSFIDKLNERTVMVGMGAEMLDGLTGDLKFSRETNAPSFVWEGENDENLESTPNFDHVKLSPKRGGTFVDISNQLMKQTSGAVERRIQNQLINTVQRGLERTAIMQTNASAPQGIFDLASADLTGENGVVTDFYDLVVDLESEVAVSNADIGSLGYYTNAKVRGKLKKTRVDAGSGIHVFDDGMINSYPVGVSNLMPNDLTSGTGNDLSGIIYGNFNDLVFGMWGGLEILVDPYTQGTKGVTRLVLNVYSDVAVLRGDSFSFAKVDLT